MSLLKNLFYQNKITSSLLIIVLALSLVLAPTVQLSAAEGEQVDEVCDPSHPEYDVEFCEEEGEEEAVVEEDFVSESASEAPIAQECEGMKEDCIIPETGPGEVVASLLGVMILGYGARKWMMSRHAKHVAMENLYKNNI